MRAQRRPWPGRSDKNRLLFCFCKRARTSSAKQRVGNEMSSGLQPGTWTVDPAASTVAFSVRNFLINTVRGNFPIQSASVIVGEDHQPSVVSATLDVNGFFTGNTRRDTHIKSAQFFDGMKYPTVGFRSTSICETSPGEWRIAGELALRDQVSPLVLTARADAAPGCDRAEVVARAQIDRRQVGLAAGPSLVIGNSVSVEVSVVLRLEL